MQAAQPHAGFSQLWRGSLREPPLTFALPTAARVENNPVPFPLVAVDLPPETPAEYASALLDACRQAYIEGDCATNVTENAPLKAEVRWTNGTEALLFVKPEEWPAKQWLRRGLRFEPADAALERHRTLGYAIGSLAGTAAEMLRRQEARAEPPKDEPSPADAVSPPPERPAPERPPPQQPTPQQPAPPLPARASAPLQGAYGAGLLVGSGFESARFGAALGVQLIWQQHWTGQLWLSYSSERETRGGLAPSHVEGAVLLGHRFILGPIATTLSGGLHVEHLSIPTTISDTNEPNYELSRAPRPFVSPRVGLLVNATSLPVSPFVDAALNWQEATEVAVRTAGVSDALATRDRLQLRVVFGISVHPEAWSD